MLRHIDINTLFYVGNQMSKIRIALIGGGPSALSIVKALIHAQPNKFTVDIFERNGSLGKGMPYSENGASCEHITNVSSDELAPFSETLEAWMSRQSKDMLADYGVDQSTLHAKQVIPRLLFGVYLEQQFTALLTEGEKQGLITRVHLNTNVLDIVPNKADQTSDITLTNRTLRGFDKVIICTGHEWPKQNEDKVAGYYDSPYPPSKLSNKYNHSVALKGSSLTAIDAVRSLSHANGRFHHELGYLTYERAYDVPDFKIVMHSLHGLMPSLRFHLDSPLVSEKGMLSEQQIAEHRAQNDGFLSLDFIFLHNFKAILQVKDPEFYRKIQDKNLEAFVEWMLESRMAFEPFDLFKIEYLQAEQSIQNEDALHWKEVLALLSFTINHPAKYLSAEDMTRLRSGLLPLIGLIIANVPQSSAEQLMALHHCGILEVIPVDSESHIEIKGHNEFNYHYSDSNKLAVAQKYSVIVDCTGQPHLPIDTFPFKSMFSIEPILPAKVRFKDKQQGAEQMVQRHKNINLGSDNEYYLSLPGFAINDHYQPILENGSPSHRYFIMAVPYISGFNPDYSGFDFCEQVANLIVNKLCQKLA